MFHTIRRLRPRALGTRVTIRGITDLASAPSSKTQVYVSRSRSPFLNLSIEHHLLQKTPSDSTVLFLYTNRPCVVIGRNQNPWLEVNLPLLSSFAAETQTATHDAEGGNKTTSVELVRRRSGGGTVFHDEGNVNFSVICPPSAFDRDKHAEMVVRALRSLSVDGARVNCRHDIVVDVPSIFVDEPVGEPSCKANEPPMPGLSTFKISGSAYKLTRLRSLHHGTCLLSSPNLGNIGKLLRSPAEPFIKGRGVDSVRSPVRNVGVPNARFEDAVVKEFAKMYGEFDVARTVGDEEGKIEAISKGMKELESRDWIYGQTPLFTFSTHPTEDDERPRPAIPGNINLNFEARHGIIQKLTMGSQFSAAAQEGSSLLDSRFYDFDDWTKALIAGGAPGVEAKETGEWLNGLFAQGRL